MVVEEQLRALGEEQRQLQGRPLESVVVVEEQQQLQVWPQQEPGQHHRQAHQRAST